MMSLPELQRCIGRPFEVVQAGLSHIPKLGEELAKLSEIANSVKMDKENI